MPRDGRTQYRIQLVYIHATKPARRFVGCGTLIEGGYVATCRHVWRLATEAAQAKLGDAPEAEIEFPRARHDGATIKSPARLADACEAEGRAPDLVMLLPNSIPSGVMTLQLAAHERFEVGEGYAIAGVRGLDPAEPMAVRDIRFVGVIHDHISGDDKRQFTGTSEQGFWAERGSSGSPVFLRNGQQLAGILSLSMLGANQGKTRIKEAFVVPGTIVRFTCGSAGGRAGGKGHAR